MAKRSGGAKFERKSVVWITVDGNIDVDLVPDLLDWCLQNRVYATVRGGASGPDFHVGGYSPEDAQKIADWLLARGATETSG